MPKKILTVRFGKHKGRTYYATEKTFEILYGILGALFMGAVMGFILLATAMSKGAI